MLQHQHPAGGGDGDGAARSAFARDGGDRRRAQRQTALGRAGDGLGLAALLGAQPRIGAGGVDEAENRQAELFGHVHQPHRLAVAFRPRHAEVVGQAGRGVVALLMAHDDHGAAAKARQAADDGLVVSELAVSAQLDEVGEQPGDVIHQVRPLRVARDLRLHPGIKRGVGLVPHLRGLAAQAGDLGLEGVLGRGQQRQLLDLGFQIGDRLFEIEIVRGHDGVRKQRAAEGAPRQGGAT